MLTLGRGNKKISIQYKIIHLRKSCYCSKEQIFWWAMPPIAPLFHVNTKFSQTAQTFSIYYFNEENVFKVHNFITPLRTFLTAGFQITVWSIDSDMNIRHNRIKTYCIYSMKTKRRREQFNKPGTSLHK